MADDPFIKHLRGTQQRTQRLLQNAEHQSAAKYGWVPGVQQHQASPSVMAFDARWVTRMSAAKAPLQTLIPPALQHQAHGHNSAMGYDHLHIPWSGRQHDHGQAAPAIQPSPARLLHQQPPQRPNPPPAWYNPGNYPITDAVNTIDHLGVILDATTPVPPDWVARRIPHIQEQITPIAQLPTLTSLQHQLGVLQGSFQGAMEILGCLSSLSSLAHLALLHGTPQQPEYAHHHPANLAPHQGHRHHQPVFGPPGHHPHDHQAQLPGWWGTPPEPHAHPATVAPDLGYPPPHLPTPHKGGPTPAPEVSFSHTPADQLPTPPDKPHQPHHQHHAPPLTAQPPPLTHDQIAGATPAVNGDSMIDALLRKNMAASGYESDVFSMTPAAPVSDVAASEQLVPAVQGSTFLAAHVEPEPLLPAFRPGIAQDRPFDDSAGRQAGAMPPAGMGRLAPPQRHELISSTPASPTQPPPGRRPRRPLEGGFDDSARRMAGRAPLPDQQPPADLPTLGVHDMPVVADTAAAEHQIGTAPAAGMHTGARMWMDLGRSQDDAQQQGIRISGIVPVAASTSSLGSTLDANLGLPDDPATDVLTTSEGAAQEIEQQLLRQSEQRSGPPTPTVLTPPTLPALAVPPPIETISTELLLARRTYATVVQTSTPRSSIGRSSDAMRSSEATHSHQDLLIPTASSSPAHSSAAASTPRLASGVVTPRIHLSPTQSTAAPVVSAEPNYLDVASSARLSTDPTQPRITFSPDAKGGSRADADNLLVTASFASTTSSANPLAFTWGSTTGQQAFPAATDEDAVLMGTVGSTTSFPVVTEEDAVLMGTVGSTTAFPVVTDEDAVLMGTVSASTPFPTVTDEDTVLMGTVDGQSAFPVITDDEAVLMGTVDSAVAATFPTLDIQMAQAPTVATHTTSHDNSAAVVDVVETTTSQQLVTSVSSSTVVFGSLPSCLTAEQQDAFSALTSASSGPHA